jgi:AraC-like DNA-binding protein
MTLSNEDKDSLVKVKRLIELEFKTHYTTDYLAGIALMSRSKLIKIYRIYYGMALFEHLQSYRQLTGKKLLEETTLSIKAISYKCGYQHACNFSTAFKKAYGLKPKEYRKQVLGL